MAVKGVTVTIDQIGQALGEMLTEYSEVVVDATREAVRKAGKEGAKVARAEGGYQNRRPKYRKSITNRTDFYSYKTTGLIYAKGHEYSLTHLLENGHKLWNAPNRRTRAFKHWVKAEETAAEELPKIIIDKIAHLG